MRHKLVWAGWFWLVARVALAGAAPPSAVEGAVVYSHEGRIHLMEIGGREPLDLGPGRYARFSPDGKTIAGLDGRTVFVMGARGDKRVELVSDAADRGGAAIEFHSNGREVIFLRKKQGLFAVNIAERTVRKLPAPGEYTGEPVISADGTRMAVGWGEDLYAVDLIKGTHRKYGKGCSPGVSPDGKWLMRNVGGHHRMRIETWEGDRGFEIDAASCVPERRWDNHHWSNHPNYIAAQGDADQHFVYLFDVAANRGTQVVFERADSPDVFIRRAPTAPLLSSLVTESPSAPPPERVTGQWPGNDEGLAFLWENARKPNEVRVSAEGKTATRTCRLMAKDAGRFNGHHGLELSGGGFGSEEDPEPLLAAVRKGGAFTFEAVVTAPVRGRERKGSRIAAFADNFVLRDSREDLRVYLRTSDAHGRGDEEERETVLGALPSGPTHVIVSYRPGLLVYYANGKELFHSSLLRGDVRGFAPGPLTFGAGPRDQRPWRGALDTVAIYGRFIDAAEAARKFALVQPSLARRAAQAPLSMRGRALKTTAPVDPDAIAPYRRALSVTIYEILEGPEALQGKQVQVAHWAVLDARSVVRTARIKPGDRRNLEVVLFDSQPQLQSERLVGDTMDLPLYFDTGPVERGDLQRADGS